jgi:predicted enzyme related to lactoylglutathione lyase
MIVGSHFLLYSQDPEADRTFFRDVLRLPFVDAGDGWLIFAMSPAEAGIHPSDGESSRSQAGHRLLGAALYLMCDDLEGMIASLKARKVRCSKVEKAPWGRVTTIPLPSGARIGLYQPMHPTALNLKAT